MALRWDILVTVVELIFCHDPSKRENPLAAGHRRAPVGERDAAERNISPCQSDVQYYLGACASAFCVRAIAKLLLTIFFSRTF